MCTFDYECEGQLSLFDVMKQDHYSAFNLQTYEEVKVRKVEENFIGEYRGKKIVLQECNLAICGDKTKFFLINGNFYKRQQTDDVEDSVGTLEEEELYEEIIENEMNISEEAIAIACTEYLQKFQKG